MSTVGKWVIFGVGKGTDGKREIKGGREAQLRCEGLVIRDEVDEGKRRGDGEKRMEGGRGSCIVRRWLEAG